MLPEIDRKTVLNEVITGTPARIIEHICEYRRIAAESINKINVEGTVVRTLKGDVIQHPSIKVHSDATKSEAALLKEWAKKRYD